MRRRLEGYFTVEAAMVLPMVFGVILVIVYLLFFQYNRCLQEQDMGILALRGRTLQAENNEERIRQLREQADNLYDDKYVAWERGEIELKLEKGTINVKQSSRIIFPFWRMNYVNRSWDTTTEYENSIISPASFIRNYRKVIGGQ